MPNILLEKRNSCEIRQGKPWNKYELDLGSITEKEKEFIKVVRNTLDEDRTLEELEVIYLKDKERVRFIEKVKELEDVLPKRIDSLFPSEELIERISQFIGNVAPYVENKRKVAKHLLNELIGLGVLTGFMKDDKLEEVMVNGAGKKVFVFDRDYGICETNVVFQKEKDIRMIAKKVAEFVGKEINESNPLLDARLPDGSRVNATIPPASPHASTLTIRKFRKKPFTVTELIKNGTITSEAMAFLWLCVEGMGVHPSNIIIAGSTGSGKTTTLNNLSIFIPPEDRMVTIEDTLELNLRNRSNWVQLESRPGNYDTGLSLDDLLKNSIRMRPDRVVVGEVRGKEAETMFTAMDIGHQGVMSTLHANSPRETILRLRSNPMNVPKAMFSLLDLIVMQHRMQLPNKGLKRKVTQISEVKVLGEHILLNDIYKSSKKGDGVERTNLPSHIIESIAENTGKTKNQVSKELRIRQAILEYLVEKNIMDYEKILSFITDYYEGPEKVLDKINGKRVIVEDLEPV